MTLAYAAPEQVLALPITVAADVYALGVMLAELLAGARLYRSQEPRALEAEILTGDLRVPSAIASDKARARALKGDLDAIVATALKRQPPGALRQCGRTGRRSGALPRRRAGARPRPTAAPIG